MNYWKKLRIEAGYRTQAEAAEKMGYSEDTIASWETDNNPRTPPRIVEMHYLGRKSLGAEKFDKVIRLR